MAHHQKLCQQVVSLAGGCSVLETGSAEVRQLELDDVARRGKLQRDFVDFVLVPLWEPYTQLWPELRPCYDNLVRNRALYDYRSIHGEDADSTERATAPAVAGG